MVLRRYRAVETTMALRQYGKCGRAVGVNDRQDLGIRGEFMRASRVLATRPERAIIALADLCEERRDEDLVAAPPYVSSRVSLPPQTPYTVGSQSMRLKGAPPPERLSPPTKFFEPGPRQTVSIRPPPPEQMPEHMAPKRSKWTSPPPAEAPSADHSLFESQLGIGLELATSSTDAREKEASYHSSSSNSEFLTDEENRSDAAESDDVTSVRSYTEGSTMNGSGGQRRPSWHISDTAVRIPQSTLGTHAPGGRVRYPRPADTPPMPAFRHSPLIPQEPIPCSPRGEGSKHPVGPPRLLRGGAPWPLSGTPAGHSIPLPPSPDSPMDRPPSFIESSTVFYQTTVPRSPRPNVLYPSSGSHSSILSQYQTHPHPYHSMNAIVPNDIFPPNMPPSIMSLNPRTHASLASDLGRSPETPTPATYSYSHGHSMSTTTITSATPPPPHPSDYPPAPESLSSLPTSTTIRGFSRSELRAMSRSPPPYRKEIDVLPREHGEFISSPKGDGSGSPLSPHPSSTTSNGSSPAPSSAGYAASLSRSPSPHSPSPPPTAIPLQLKQKASGDEEDDTDLPPPPVTAKPSVTPIPPPPGLEANFNGLPSLPPVSLDPKPDPSPKAQSLKADS
ncbi:hypothetical protein C0991_005780 [Blastosporella zonata]|nr:hypothetical protein C0991_005780 [Blastosporella zonata]